MDGEKGKLADSTAFLRDPNDVCEFIIPLLVLTVICYMLYVKYMLYICIYIYDSQNSGTALVLIWCSKQVKDLIFGFSIPEYSF